MFLVSKFCICSVEILCFRVEILYFRIEILYFRVEILYFRVQILYFRIQILYFGNQIGNFDKIQFSSLPRNTNSVTPSECKYRHNLEIQTTSKSKFPRCLRIQIWSHHKNWKFNWNCKISFQKFKINAKIIIFRSKNENFDPKMQNTKFRFEKSQTNSQNIVFKD